MASKNSVKVQDTREVNSFSTYNKFRDRNPDCPEDPRANPDVLAHVEKEEESEELAAILRVLDCGGEKILTPRQRRAFQLVVREGISERKAAKKMGCKQATIQGFVKSACIKLCKLTLSYRCFEPLNCKSTLRHREKK